VAFLPNRLPPDGGRATIPGENRLQAAHAIRNVLPTTRLTSVPLRHAAAGLCRSAAVLGWVMLSSVSLAAEPQAVLTLLEGEATLIIGNRAYAAATGARLGAGTIVETEASTGVLRLEWPDGAVLDLGPATRVMLRPGAGGAGAKTPLLYLQRGWAKQSQAAVLGGQLSAAFDVAPFKGVVVSQMDDSQAVLFCEAGSAPFVARRSESTAVLRAGESAVISAAGATQVTPRPSADWLRQLPRSFRETLPQRAAQFAQLPAAVLQPKAALSYARLQHWLAAEPALRRGMPTRFSGLLADRTFREAVNARLNQHPEWEPLLRPPRPAATVRKNTDTSVMEQAR